MKYYLMHRACAKTTDVAKKESEMGIKNVVIKINNMIEPLRTIARKFGEPLFDLSIRLYMANVFIKSGWSKFKNFLNDDWGSTVFLFEEVHPLPGLPAELSAILATGGEVILPILLAFGLFGRFGAGGLLIMTATIQFLVPAEYGMQNADHYFWMFLLGAILIRGSGVLSLDTLLMKWIKN